MIGRRRPPSSPGRLGHALQAVGGGRLWSVLRLWRRLGSSREELSSDLGWFIPSDVASPGESGTSPAIRSVSLPLLSPRLNSPLPFCSGSFSFACFCSRQQHLPRKLREPLAGRRHPGPSCTQVQMSYENRDPKTPFELMPSGLGFAAV